MKHVNAMGMLLFLSSLILSSCNNEKTYPLTLEKSSCEIRLGMGKSIQITSGNDDYSVTVKDPDIANASAYMPPPYETHYYLSISGKQKGTTTVTVRDNATRQTSDVVIKIVDCYLSFLINETDYTLFPKLSDLFLVNNEARDFYVFGQEAQSYTLKGTYEFSVTDHLPYITLSYPNGSKTETITFELGKSSPELFSLIDYYFKSDMVSSMTRMSVAPPIYMQMDEVNTNKKLSLKYLHGKEIPKNILK